MASEGDQSPRQLYTAFRVSTSSTIGGRTEMAGKSCWLHAQFGGNLGETDCLKACLFARPDCSNVRLNMQLDNTNQVGREGVQVRGREWGRQLTSPNPNFLTPTTALEMVSRGELCLAHFSPASVSPPPPQFLVF